LHRSGDRIGIGPDRMRKPESDADPRRLAVRILDRVFRSNSYADILLDSAFKKADIEAKDRALATELVYGTLRWWGKLDFILRRTFHGKWQDVPDPVRRTCEIALYQILFLDRVPAYAAVDEAVRTAGEFEGGRWKGTVNAVLRSLIRNPDTARVPEDAGDPVKSLSMQWSHPEWLVEEWLRRFSPERTEAICRADNQRPGISVRINPLRSDVPAVLKELENTGISAESNPYLKEFIFFGKAGDVGALPGLREGRYTVQDASAGLVAHLIDPRPDEPILALAAAPGGKTTHMAELGGDRAVIAARDIHSRRLLQVTENVKRLGLHSVTTETGDGRKPAGRLFDKVLVDAPCSGMGVLRRRPELKWRRVPDDIAGLVSIQRALLETAAASLKEGGILVYSTCTVIEKENREVIAEFLNAHEEFQTENAVRFVHPDLVSGSGFVETWPDTHGMDGSFAVRMKKTESSIHESI
jgi:16S rRNA (cytosine967-C5)-methyltransferase